MTVTNVRHDPEQLTLTITAAFDAPIGRVWQLWADPRQVEQWWGPPGYPATFLEHRFEAGGAAAYFMTGPNGDRHHGWWNVRVVDAPHRLEFDDGFADAAGTPDLDLPVTSMRIGLGIRDGGGTTMTSTTSFPSFHAMNELIELGIEDGLLDAMGQMDVVLRGES